MVDDTHKTGQQKITMQYLFEALPITDDIPKKYGRLNFQ